MQGIQLLESRLGHTFSDQALLNQGLTHRSFGSPHNERLEFLGDSLLNCLVAAELFDRFPRLREGELSRLRAHLVREATLHALAQSLQIGELIRLGEGELKSGGFNRPSILADAFEAVIGAVYLDGGFSATRAVVNKLFEPQFGGLDGLAHVKDPKTELQEILQSRGAGLPLYEVITTTGAAHSQTFEVRCSIAALQIETFGRGASRRSAEQAAASDALVRARV
jgi:ribonuclease III